ncbi:MAG: SET domain-containing protein [Patescibacteria group bacterium]|jgi:SET domain-containing protein
MLHIKYKLAPSIHHGIGLFADQNIQKNQLIYSASPLLDVNISPEEFSKLSLSEQAEISYWGFLDKQSGLWHVDFDVSKFINHSSAPNITQDPISTETRLIALKDISAGEELTQNYLEFETKEDLKRRGIST